LADVLAREYCREVKPHGPGRQRTLCVFHDETDASLVLNENSNTFKCFGCGEHGDVFTLVMKLDGLSFLQAVEKLAKRAAISLNGSNGQKPTAMPAPRQQDSNTDQERDLFAEWRDCVAALTDAHIDKLATWRSYSVEFCQWLRHQGLVGLHEGKIAFPVREGRGPVVAFHYRLDDGTWRYHPTGCRVRPLVIGEPETADSVFLFESQWDAFAVLDKLDWHKQALPSVAVIVTRGASNGGKLLGLLKNGATVYAFRQNDDAAEKWLQDVADAATVGGATVKLVVTPNPHKDANDWTRARARSEDIRAAMEAAPVVRPPSKSEEPQAATRPLLVFRKPSEWRDYTPPDGAVLVGDQHITLGSVVVIGGQAGIGKSRAAVALSVAGATLKEWFGLAIHRHFKTLILQNENGGLRLKDEFSDIDCAGLDAYCRICEPPEYGMRFDANDFREALKVELDSFTPDVVVLDPWNSVALDDKQRDYLEAFRAIRAVIPAGENSPALVIVAHTRKPKSDHRPTGRDLLHELAGSYGLGSVPRTVFIMQPATPDLEDNRIVWNVAKANNAKEPGGRSCWERRNGLFAPVTDFDLREFDKPTSERLTITESDLAEVFQHGKRSLRKIEAVEDLMERTGARKSACYTALKLDGRHAPHLSEEAGLLTWKP
jgi:hypothetical protein